jgi:hypothetical protein
MILTRSSYHGFRSMKVNAPAWNSGVALYRQADPSAYAVFLPLALEFYADHVQYLVPRYSSLSRSRIEVQDWVL